MFLLIGIHVLLSKPEGQLLVRSADPIPAVAVAFGSNDRFLYFAFTPIHLSALAEHARPVSILELDRKMVVNVPIILVWPSLPSAQCRSFFRMRIEYPIHDIEVVHV